MYFKSRYVRCFVSFIFVMDSAVCQYQMPRLFLFCNFSSAALPLDCAPFTFSFILSKSRCPVLTAGLRIYLTKEYCMFNNGKRKKTKRIKKKRKKENAGGEKKEENKGKKIGVIYILMNCMHEESHI